MPSRVAFSYPRNQEELDGFLLEAVQEIKEGSVNAIHECLVQKFGLRCVEGKLLISLRDLERKGLLSSRAIKVRPPAKNGIIRPAVTRRLYSFAKRAIA